MDFSKKYLIKYGWEEGQGLGKMEDGIKQAIKPKLKFDKAGMGYDPSVEFTDSWWVNVYNDALEKANVNEEDGENKERVEYERETKTKKKKTLTEESYTELFNACEGRTVHKGARQGLKLSGKLQRLQQQELHLLSKKETQIINETKSHNLKSSKRNTETSVDNETEEKRARKRKRNKCESNTK